MRRLIYGFLCVAALAAGFFYGYAWMTAGEMETTRESSAQYTQLIMAIFLVLLGVVFGARAMRKGRKKTD